jgi:hypothetical protein
MSRHLLTAAALDKPYLQSPVDDLVSFYFVAQWAVVNNNRDFPDPAVVSDELQLLRKLLAGSLSERELATTMIRESLDSEVYGTFAAECQPILQEWDRRLMMLTQDWRRTLKTIGPHIADQHRVYYPLFRKFTDRGVLELLQIVQARFGESLKGVS